MALVIVAALCQPPLADAAAQIRSVRRTIDLAFARHDSKHVASLFLADFHFTAPTTHIDGSDQFQRSNAALFAKRPDITLTHDSARIAVNEQWDLASEQGEWIERWTEKDGVTELRGSYLAMWKRDRGLWRAQSETIIPEACSGSSYCNHK